MANLLASPCQDEPTERKYAEQWRMLRGQADHFGVQHTQCLQQQFFATTATNFIGGAAFDITTFPATDPVAVALGARLTEPEPVTPGVAGTRN